MLEHENLNHYEVLGLDHTATQSEIKEAYRRKAFALHPDVSDGGAEEFVRVSEAYMTLKNVREKARYDERFGTVRNNISINRGSNTLAKPWNVSSSVNAAHNVNQANMPQGEPQKFGVGASLSHKPRSFYRKVINETGAPKSERERLRRIHKRTATSTSLPRFAMICAVPIVCVVTGVSLLNTF